MCVLCYINTCQVDCGWQRAPSWALVAAGASSRASGGGEGGGAATAGTRPQHVLHWENNFQIKRLNRPSCFVYGLISIC